MILNLGRHAAHSPSRALRHRLRALLPILALILTGAACIVNVTTAQADESTCKSDFFLTHTCASHVLTGWTPVIVKLKGACTPQREAQLQAVDADIYRRLPLIHSLALRVPTRNLARLAALPFVEHLSTDAPVKKCDQFTVDSSGANVAWQQPYNLGGSGVTVAILDSGIRSVPDLSSTGLPGISLLRPSRILAKANFVSGDTSTDDACGHGTHVAGIVSGNGASSSGLIYFRTFYGIAPQSNLINVRVLDGVGAGNVSQVIAGIQWVINNKAAYKIRVMNLSLGHPVGESYTTDPLCQAVEQAWKAGIVVVCAAGNGGRMNASQTAGAVNEGYGTAYGSIQSPGNDPYVITVGAMKATDLVFNSNGAYTHTRANDRIATYSSRGPTRLDLVLKPDILAPGNQIISLLAYGSFLDTNYSAGNQIPLSFYSLNLFGGNSMRYFRLSGTSMAAPVVAGTAALMLQAQPGLSPDTVKARLMLSATKWTDPAGNLDPCTYGAGYLNIPAALNSTAVAAQYAVSPPLYEGSDGNVYINSSLWGNQVIWGLNGVSNALQSIWGTQIIWGNQILWGSGVWTDQVIWGEIDAAADLSSNAINGE